MREQTLVLIKPDGVKRGLIGKIISRFEEAGLKIIGMKMLWTDEALALEHYRLDEEWAKGLHAKTSAAYQKENKPMIFKDPLELGRMVQKGNMEFLMECPVIAMALDGPHAIELVRKIIGSTEPRQAVPGTIRGDFASIESYAVANSSNRTLRNLIHASDSPESGKREISLWFKENELYSSYTTLHQASLGH